MSEFGLFIASIGERLERIEQQLSIEGMTPAQAELAALIDEEGDE